MDWACNRTFFFLIQRNFNQTLCVFSHMNNIRQIRQNFHSAAWVMPQGWDLGVPWGVGVGGVRIFFFEFQPDLVCQLLT